MTKYSYTNEEFEEKKPNKIVDLIKKYKTIIAICLAVIVLTVLVVLLAQNTIDNSKVTNSKNGLSINLIGNSTVVIAKNQDFLDPGYAANDKEEGDLTDKVQLTGIIDTTKVGTYTRYYTVINKDGTIVEITRTIIVKNITNTDSTITITLKGSSTISLKQNEKYIEPGYTAVDSKKGDVTNQVQVTGNVDTSKPGVYTKEYIIKNSEGKSSTAKRTIIVVANEQKDSDIKASISINTTAYTKNTVTLTLNVEGNDYEYAVLPNGYKTYRKIVDYSVATNGTYKFYIYDKNNNVQTISKIVSNIDKTGPTGTCSGTINGNQTKLSVNASDNLSGLSYYIYKSGTSSQKSYSSNYTFNVATKSVSVQIYDSAGNYNTVSCNIQGEVPNVPISNGKLEIHFVNVGREDGIVIRSANKVIVIDGGTYSSGSKMVDYIKGLGITKIDYLIGSHLHYNHIQAHAKIINSFVVDKVYYGQNLFTCKPNYCDSQDQKYVVDALKKKNMTPIVMKNGDQMTIDTNLTLKCIGPKTFRSYSQDKYPQNYNSLNFIITFGIKKFMFTGDGVQQSSVLGQYSKDLLNVDVLKHPHHGNHSLTKTFVETISPTYDILTSSSDELSSKQSTTKKYLSSIGTKFYYSYISKNILITSDGKNIEVKTNVLASQYRR